MPLKPLAQLTLRELLDQVADENLQVAGQILSAVQATYGLPLLFTATPSLSLIDWQRESAIAGRGFAGFVNTGPVAGQNSHVQLWNPATSGVVGVVRAVFAEPVGGASFLVFKDHNAALTTLAGPGKNRRLGAANSVLELRSQNNAALLGTTFDTIADTARPEVLQIINRDGYYVVPPGRGFILVPLTQALAIDAFYLWDEVPT